MKKIYPFYLCQSYSCVSINQSFDGINYWELSAKSNFETTSHHSIIPHYIYFIIQKEHSVSPVFQHQNFHKNNYFNFYLKYIRAYSYRIYRFYFQNDISLIKKDFFTFPRLIYGLVLIPVLEELSCRIIIINKFKDKLNQWIIIITTGCIWHATCREYIYCHWFIMLRIYISIFIYHIKKWTSSYIMSFLL